MSRDMMAVRALLETPATAIEVGLPTIGKHTLSTLENIWRHITLPSNSRPLPAYISMVDEETWRSAGNTWNNNRKWQVVEFLLIDGSILSHKAANFGIDTSFPYRALDAQAICIGSVVITAMVAQQFTQSWSSQGQKQVDPEFRLQATDLCTAKLSRCKSLLDFSGSNLSTLGKNLFTNTGVFLSLFSHLEFTTICKPHDA
ncbi:hypothetical protein C8R43DRAFT_943980 [Mycena crocata]|nr:hypothetical protein C8R43DRAFT_943980 [Mycena crocata]